MSFKEKLLNELKERYIPREPDPNEPRTPVNQPPDMSKQFICTSCGFVGMPKKIVKGSFLMELLLWLLFIIPGLIYSVWRLSSKDKACPKCKNPTMIPVQSPMGQKLFKELISR